MTKWKRMRKLRERKRAEVEALNPKAEPEAKPADQINLGDPRKIKKPEPTRTFNSNPILAQIPRYVYLAVIFSLLSGVFFPLITPGVPFDSVIQGTLALFLGLVGGILLFKTVTSDNRRGIFIAAGFSLITISLVLIFWIQEASIF